MEQTISSEVIETAIASATTEVVTPEQTISKKLSVVVFTLSVCVFTLFFFAPMI